MGVKLLAWRGNDKKLSKKQVKQVSKIVNKTKKYKMCYGGYPAFYAGVSVSTWTEMMAITGTQGLQQIAEGDESYQRQGDTIMLKHYKINMGVVDQYQFETTTADEYSTTSYNLRVVVARLFGTYTGTATSYFSNTNINANFEVEKGTVLFDKRFPIQRSLDVKSLLFTVPCKTKTIPHILVQYNDADPVGVEKNDIRVFVIYSVNSPVPSTSQMLGNLLFDLSTSIGYYDKY